MPNPVKDILQEFRNHRHFIIIMPLLIIVMTWPTFVHVFDTDTFWLSSTSNDNWMKIWDAWYFKRILAGDAGYLFTDSMFYPNGLSLVYHNYNFPHMIVLSGLLQFIPTSNAFNASYLLIVGLNGAAAYLYVFYLFRSRSLGLIGAVIFGMSPLVISHPHHPDINLVAVIPLALYFLDRGIVERRWLWICLSGLFMALTPFISMYIYFCLAITVGLFMLCYAIRFWSNVGFWRKIIVLLLIVGPASVVRVYPLIENSSHLAEALEKRGGRERFNDVLAYFVNPANPVTSEAFTSIFSSDLRILNIDSYLGYVPLLLVTAGIFRGKRRRKMAPWLIVIFVFLVLRLGSVLTIGGQSFDQVRLPKYYLDTILPVLFEPFWETSHFQIGIILPLAVLACFGLEELLNAFSPKYHHSIVLLVFLFVAFEYYQIRTPMFLPSQQLSFIDWLRREQDQDLIRLIHLPMGRNESKLYGYYQTLSGYAHVEGLAGRTPPSAYTYINGNLVLKTWMTGRLSIHCLPASRRLYLSALDQLLSDGFTHIVLHHWRDGSGPISHGFAAARHAYEDEYVRIYRLEQHARKLRERPISCTRIILPISAPGSVTISHS